MPWLPILFVAALAAATSLRFWLSSRQIRSVAAGRSHVPAAFADRVALADHQKAADYTIAQARLGRVGTLVDAAAALLFTLGGGIAAIDALWAKSQWSQPWQGAAVVLTVVCLTALLDLPLSVWRTFRLEARFGFNRTTATLFVTDLCKSAALALLIGAPVIIAALLLMDRAGRFWWVWAGFGWLALTLVITWAWPVFLAPLFNRFSPLEDPALQSRIESLLKRCGFTLQGIFVVDGSRRSAHGNAYFTGIGRHKRIVFFDTLLARLTHSEVESVLAHELGHFKLQHVRQRMLVMIAASFVAIALLGWCATQHTFYTAMGVPNATSHAALLLYMFIAPVCMFFATPLGALWSRRHEFEADAFAARFASARELAAALVKLYRDNATTLTPDSVYSAFYYSHPPALERIARLRQSTLISEPAPASG